jgi:hypothetical protein
VKARQNLAKVPSLDLAVVVYLKVLSQYLPVKTEQSMKTVVRITGKVRKIQRGHITNWSLECYRNTTLLGTYIVIAMGDQLVQTFLHI